jgi:hypothetical protein
MEINRLKKVSALQIGAVASPVHMVCVKVTYSDNIIQTKNLVVEIDIQMSGTVIDVN